jgi:methyl-accepting chemotaxis protein
VDQHIEEAVACVETIIAVAQQTSEPLPTGERAELVDRLQGAAEDIEETVERVDRIVAAGENAPGSAEPTADFSPAEVGEATGHPRHAVELVDTNIDDLDRITQRMKGAVEEVKSTALAAHDDSRTRP